MDAFGFEGFEDWYLASYSAVLAAVLVALGEADVAAEATDEAFARALSNWRRVSGMARPIGWTITVGVNVGKRRLSRRRHEDQLIARVDRSWEVPAPAGEIWDVVRALPIRQRTIVALRYAADLPEAEIAKLLRISRSTVSSSLTIAHRKLADLIQECADTEGAAREPL